MSPTLPTDYENACKWFREKLGHTNSDENTIKMTETEIAVNLGEYGICPEWWLLIERSFLASCSSSWSWGCVRTPAVKVDTYEFETSGMCDPFEDIYNHFKEKTENLYSLALEKCQIRKTQNKINSAGRFLVLNIDLFNTFENGLKINETSLSRLDDFHILTGSYNLNQCGYEVISHNNDNVIMIVDTEDNLQYHRYLFDSLKCLNKNVNGITVGIAYGDIYYISRKNIVSEAINQNWLNMKKPLRSGDIIVDLSAIPIIGKTFSQHNFND